MGEIIKSENTLKQAREYIKLAEDYARYKLVDGYNEDDFSILEIFNLDASLTICDRGPADYYYEKAYDMLCACLGKDHPETRQLGREIVNYHVNIVQRMMQENYMIILIIVLVYLVMNLTELIADKLLCAFYIAACNAALAIFWYLEQTLMCFMERRHYRKVYNQ